ncbi:MAG: sensor histidine kinase [Schwartzia sp.]|nr:sensor histidine kinase [Schwartzia sp. (in: firmicutes)]
MALIVGMAAGIMLIQAVGAYLRYLPFEARLLTEERARFWKYILFWAPVAFGLYVAYFWHSGFDVAAYKRVNYFGWMPFFAFSLLVIRRGAVRHVFVLGMQMLWYFLLHTMSGVLILALLPPAFGTGVPRLSVQTALYLFLFLAMLPLERRIFRRLLPPYLFSGNRWAGWCFAMMPLGLCATPFVLLLDRPLMYTWSDMLLRVALFFGGIVLYRYLLYIGERAARMQNERHTNELLTRQLEALEAHAAMLQSRAEEVQRARHDLRHHNRLLLSLLRGGEVEKAVDFIEAQDRALMASPVAVYCKSPILNAALTVYVQMAKRDGIRVSCAVDMDKTNVFGGRDNDLAILLSNVMENAVIASRKQPDGEREMRVTLSHVDGQYALVAENRYDAPIAFGEDGLPTTKERGHGTGMVSLRNFAEKYGASVLFEQRDGWVRLLMYWDGEENVAR